MWTDDGGGTDAGATGTSDDMLVTVGGDEYTADVNFDVNEDGVNDTAVIEREDGSTQAFVDHDGDGDADEYLKLDAQGNVLAEAQFDEADGEWVAPSSGTGAGSGSDAEAQTGSGGTITADMPGGDVQVGPATTDTDDDGVNDTAVTTDAEGNTVAFTDVDGDGAADIAVVIDDSGNTTTFEHSGDGEWTEVENSAAGADVGSDAAGWGEGGQAVEGVARIDAATGQWISQN